MRQIAYNILMTEIPTNLEGETLKKEDTAFPHALRDETKAHVNQLLNAPRWRKHKGEEINEEKEELREAAERLRLNYAILEKAFDGAEMEDLGNDDWKEWGEENNAELKGEWTKDKVIAHIGNKRNHASIFQGLEQGEELPVPVVLFQSGKPPYLIGGNTRLLACKALGIRPQILAVRI